MMMSKFHSVFSRQHWQYKITKKGFYAHILESNCFCTHLLIHGSIDYRLYILIWDPLPNRQLCHFLLRRLASCVVLFVVEDGTVFCTTFPLFATSLFQNLGSNIAASILASISTLFCVCPGSMENASGKRANLPGKVLTIDEDDYGRTEVFEKSSYHSLLEDIIMYAYLYLKWFVMATVRLYPPVRAFSPEP